MGDVAALEAAQDVDDRVDLADIAEELVAQALTLGRAPDQSGNVDELKLGGEDLRRLGDRRDFLKPRIRNRDTADIGLDRAEGIIGRLRGRRLGQRVEKSGLADIGQADDPAAESHGNLVLVCSVAPALSDRNVP